MKRRRMSRFSGCRSKVRFGSAQEASSTSPAQFPYLCSRCGCWHLTSQVSR